VQALTALPALRVAEPDPARPRYDRDQWQPHGWADVDGDGCNTRKEVLITEATTPPTISRTGCRLTGGRWRDRFTGFETSSDADLQIDHLVALADAHRSGGWSWPNEKKVAFSNDLDNPDELNALKADANQAKGDLGPDQWMPDDKAARCDYIRAYATIKSAWGLTVTNAQWGAIAREWPACID
jgi:hypothetical protein